MPTLLDVAERGPMRQRVLAVNALASVTGWDVRFGPNGTPRPVEVVAAEYARECGRVP